MLLYGFGFSDLVIFLCFALVLCDREELVWLPPGFCHPRFIDETPKD